jgi:lipoprotein-anchoring transpeptidase ErfK/SrfK
MKGTFPGYFRPGGRAVKLQVPETWQTEPSTLPVIGRAPGGWLHVRLAQRPDEDTAWIRASDVILSRTPYRIVVNLETTHLQLYESDRLLLDAPAGVGAADTPTPLGQYFVAFLEPPIGPEYGAFIMITSAHSQAIQSWDGTGDAIIGIHGPIGADAEIGTTGAHISNGCVRLHDNDLLRLEDVPPGTPIDIID